MGSRLTAKDLDHLALFVVKGPFDFAKFISVETNLVRSGDSNSGAEYYNTVALSATVLKVT
ncbi:MAG: hypothetical protein O3A99_06830 [Proteobacteria bacterium]|nr:hypothetical protein [Pseudomonadota bacterium]